MHAYVHDSTFLINIENDSLDTSETPLMNSDVIFFLQLLRPYHLEAV